MAEKKEAREKAAEQKKKVETTTAGTAVETAEYKELLQRLQAEFENYKKRTEKEMQQHKEYAVAYFIKKLLPMLDSFELALKNNCSTEMLRKGLELIYVQLHTTLAAEGLKPINAVGEKFDPYVHEAIVHQASEQDNIVIEEMQRGYIFKDAVLRHSKVKVGKKIKN